MAIRDNSVAIVGMAGRFPGAPTLEQFWLNLCSGVESLAAFSEAELQAAGVPPTVYNHPRYVKAGTVLEGADLLDAAFFGISPREAEILDPQHRLFLECAWEAIENGGYAPRRYPGSIGVFAGTSMNTYYGSVLARNPELMASVGGYQLMLGNDKDFLPTRVSYKLNLRGPSLGIQTACSTSLVAVQVAYESLVKHQCDMALAGGASLTFPQKAGYLYQEGMIFSPDGHCRPFDAHGRGIRGGDGVGVVVLKRLCDALADGDTVRGVIRGAAINNDGANKVGFTAPSVDGQAEVIALAQALAEVEPDTVTYIEAHGTGTPLGDPIEVAALTHVFRAGTSRKRFCALGSVKSNIGHLDAAAGVAGLIKTVLCLEHQAIPPSLNFATPNPAIDFGNSPFFVNTELAAWPEGPTPRRAGVSSFGIGGTNAHVVLEEAPSPEPGTPTEQAQVLVLSAKTRTALDAATGALAAHFEAHPEVNLADAAYTLQVGREAFQHRRMVVCTNRDDALRALSPLDPRRVLSGGEGSHPRSVVFMFSGQGSQYQKMGEGLYRAQPEFRRELDRCAELFLPHLGRDLRTILYPPPGSEGTGSAEAPPELNQTWLAQPALFAVEYALAKLWMSWGVVPVAMIGHSIGEYVAACLAGVLSLEDAVTLVAARGSLMQAVPPGAMLSVPLPEAEIAALLDGHGSLAAVNAPSLCTVSGPADTIAAVEAALAGRGVTCRRLHTSHAFHSAMMDAVLEPFRERVSAVKLNPAATPFMSNLSGTWITDAQATDPDYWVDHLRHAVHFAKGLEELGREPDRVFLEVGPGNALGAFARQTISTNGSTPVFASLPHAQERQPADHFTLSTLGRLWLLGVPVDWSGIHQGARRRRIPLPTYPFERQRYWVDPAPAAPVPAAGLDGFAKRPDPGDWFYAPSWTRSTVVDSERGAALADGAWLLFLDDQGVGESMAARLTAAGRPVATVRAGTGFAETAPGAYLLNPGSPQDYRALLAALREAGKTPAWVAHLWSVTAERPAGSALETLDSEQTLGFWSLIYLTQALANEPSDGSTGILVVSNGMQAVLDDSEAAHPGKATLLGPCRIIPQEHPHLHCRSIDLEFPLPSDAATRRLADRLLREAGVPSGMIVAYRAGRRWEQSYQPVRLDLPAPHSAAAREGGVYLITGGTGGLGLVFARHLAEMPGVTLLLIARSPLPERAEWSARLETGDPTDRSARVMRAVLELEGLGARVEVLSSDAADETRMREIVASARQRHGAIHGVIHAAGIPGGGSIQLTSPERTAATLDPKVKGTLVLEAALEDQPLDFFMLCSSINSMYAGPRSVDYCSANAFLDAFAHSRRGSGRGVVAINWDRWQEVGMAANVAVPTEMQEAHARVMATGILPPEGVEAFERIVGTGLPQVVVSTRDLQFLLYVQQLSLLQAAQQGAQGAGGDSAGPSTDGGPRHARPELANAYVAPRDDDERRIAAIWSGLLGIEDIGIHDNFFELGGHSLLATRVLARLQDSVGVTLPLETIFDAPTVAQMSERVVMLRWVAEGREGKGKDQAGREEFEI